MHAAQNLHEILVRAPGLEVLLVRCRVNDLLTQAARVEVRTLRQEHDAVMMGFLEHTVKERPQTREDTCHGRLTHTVRARDHHVVTGLDVDAETVQQWLAATLLAWRRRNDGHVRELDMVLVLDQLAAQVAQVVEGHVGRQVGGARHTLVIIVLQQMQRRYERVHTRCLAGEGSDTLVAVHEATPCVGNREQDAPVGDVALGLLDDVWVRVGLAATAPGLCTEGRDSHEQVAKRGPRVLEHKVFDRVVAHTGLEDGADMADQVAVRAPQDPFFGRCAVVEGHFLGVDNEAAVCIVKVALELGLERGEFAERWRHGAQYVRGQQVAEHRA